MSSSLLLTKLYRPTVPLKHVRRPFLVDRLNEGLEAGRQLTLVSAPAGFGKTVCVSEWLNAVDLPAAWLSLEMADNDPVRFFTYLVAAIQTVDEKIGREIQGVLRAGQLPPGEIISATLINDILGLSGRFVLVLDDFQLIQDSAILPVLQTIVSNMPPALHLVLLTREEPSLPLARLRANNQMTEIRAADLRFTGLETAAFLNETMGLSLDVVDIAALEDKTEGWVAGLQLAGLSIRDRANPSAFIARLSGSHRHILSYLTEEVLNQQPPQIQQFLLQTSILDKLHGDLCDLLTGRQDSRVLLEQLFNDNLFLVPLDDEQQWYRYHQLFAGLLRDRQNILHPETTAELHRRASSWYTHAGLSGDAIQHAIDGEDYETAIALIESNYMDRLMAWHAKTVKGWMQSLPAEMAAQSARVNLAFAWMYLMSNDFTQALPYIERLQIMFSGDSPVTESGTAEPVEATSRLAFGLEDPSVRAEWLAMQAMLLNAQGQPDQSLGLAGEALAIVPDENAYVRSLIYGGLATAYIQKNDGPRAVEAYQQLIQYGRMAGSLLSELMGVAGLALYAMERGELQFAIDLAAQGIASVNRSGTLPPISGALYGEVATVYHYRGQFEEAQNYFVRSAQVSKLSGYSDAEVYYHVIRSRQAQIKGDVETAVREINTAVELTEVEAPTAVREEVIAQRVRISLAQNQLAAAQTLLKPHGFAFQPDQSIPDFTPGQVLRRPTGLLYISALRIILFQGQNEKLLAYHSARTTIHDGIKLADHIIAEARISQQIPLIIETYLIRSQMHLVLEDEQAARADAAEALKLSEPEGFITVFLEEGAPVAGILSRLIDEGDLAKTQLEFTARILSTERPSDTDDWKLETENRKQAQTPQTPGAYTALVEPLSPRELEILRLIGQGYTNQEIAEHLVVTLHTVKKHSSNIYSKLGVRNRTQAVARARELGLL